jgi:hypothetical protein
MANEANNVLRQFITNVQQRPEWDQAGVEKQMVIAYFTTPSGFTGNVKMSLADWTNEEVRNDKLFGAIADLEGPFWEQPEEKPKKGK